MYRAFDTGCIVIRSEAAHLDAVSRPPMPRFPHTHMNCTVGMEYAISLHTHESGNEPGAAIARYPHPDGAAG
jgi:hypothetical protein